jgi:hypothetical protein
MIRGTEWKRLVLTLLAYHNRSKLLHVRGCTCDRDENESMSTVERGSDDFKAAQPPGAM